MNERIEKLAALAQLYAEHVTPQGCEWFGAFKEKFAKLLIEDVLDEVKERAYYTGDRDWSDQVDRPWIQLEFGYGKLHDAKQSGVE